MPTIVALLLQGVSVEKAESELRKTYPGQKLEVRSSTPKSAVDHADTCASFRVSVVVVGQTCDPKLIALSLEQGTRHMVLTPEGLKDVVFGRGVPKAEPVST